MSSASTSDASATPTDDARGAVTARVKRTAKHRDSSIVAPAHDRPEPGSQHCCRLLGALYARAHTALTGRRAACTMAPRRAHTGKEARSRQEPAGCARMVHRAY